jgi:hypothetical protein
MDEKSTSNVSEEDREEEDRGKCETPATFLSALEGSDTVRKYLMKFDVDYNMMVAPSSIESKVYRVSRK